MRGWGNGFTKSLGKYSDSLDGKMNDFGDRFNEQLAEASKNDDLSEVIDARKPTEQPAYQTLGQRLNTESTPVFEEANQAIKVDSILPANTVISDDVESQVINFAKSLPEGFKIAVISDSHYEDHILTHFGHYQFTQDAYKHVTALNLLSGYVDVIIANGDNTNGCNPAVVNTVAEGSDYADMITTKDSVTDRYCILGNHDDNSAFKYTQYGDNQKILPMMPADMVSESQFKTMYHTGDLINGEVRNGDSLYFYKDYDDAKIRLIGLETEDIPEDVLNDDGSIKYDRYWYHTYSQAQINWIANTALATVPEGYRIYIVGHAPINGADQYQHNQDIMLGLLDAVSTGAAYTGTSDSSVPNELKITVSADYSNQGARKIIGCLAGHIHKETITPLGNYTMATVTCDLNKSEQAIGTSDAMALTVVTIQPDKVILSGFGHATNREYSY